MRTLPPGIALLAPILALTACSSPDPLPEGTPFGESVSVPRTVSGGEHSGQSPNETADVAYTVSDVTSSPTSAGGDQVEFDLSMKVEDEVDLPDLTGLSGTCEVGEWSSEIIPDPLIPLVGGPYRILNMSCPIPEGSGTLRILIESEGAVVAFSGDLD